MMNREAASSGHARFVITGMGVVSSLGIGRAQFSRELIEGASGIRPVSLFKTDGLDSKLAGEIEGYAPAEVLGRKGLRLLDRTTTQTLCASKFALEEAGLLDSSDEIAEQTGVVVATTAGSLESRKGFFWEALSNGPRAVNPAVFPNTVVNSPASQVAIRFGIRGLNSTVSAGQCSSHLAMDYAAQLLACNRAKAMLVGGVEELCELSYLGAAKLGLLSDQHGSRGELSAPFDRDRNGAVFGEGAVMFVMESLESAKARGADVLAEYRGGASAIDNRSYNRYSIRAEGAQRAIRRALDRSRLEVDDVGYIASGASGQLIGDAAEARALSQAFDKDSSKLTVSSSKAALGETFSASGAFQIASVIAGFDHSVIPPTANYQTPDLRCAVDCVHGEARACSGDHVLVTSVSPAAQSAACLISRFSD